MGERQQIEATIQQGALGSRRLVQITATGMKPHKAHAMAAGLWEQAFGQERNRELVDTIESLREQLDRAERERDTLRRWFEDYAPPGTNPTIELGDLDAFVQALAGAIGAPDADVFDRDESGDLLGHIAEVVGMRIAQLLAALGNDKAEAFNVEHATVFELPGEASF